MRFRSELSVLHLDTKFSITTFESNILFPLKCFLQLCHKPFGHCIVSFESLSVYPL